MTNDGKSVVARVEQERQKKGDLRRSSVRFFFGDFIILFEKKCFGWHYIGHTCDVETSYNAYNTGLRVKIKENKKFIKFDYFTRPKVWKKNFLFMLTECLSVIVSFIRRYAIAIAPVLFLILIILSLVAKDWILILYIAILYAIIIALSYGLAGLGLLWRKVFKLKEQTDEILVANGFATWDQNQEGEFMQ